MPDRRHAPAWYLTGLLLLPLLPGCSLLPVASPSLPGFSHQQVAQVRQQSAALKQLQMQPHPSPAQQQQTTGLDEALKAFARDAVHTATELEAQNDWHSASELLKGALDLLPDSPTLNSALQQLQTRRHLHEDRVRMELAIHRGEQLLKDAHAYQRLEQLQGPGVMSWLELKNFHRKRNASAKSLLEYAQRALQREQRTDDQLARRALTVAQGLLGSDLQLAENTALRDAIQRHLNSVETRLRPAQPRRAKPPRKKMDPLPIAELQQALARGDLIRAQQHLNQFQKKAPRHPQLTPLQAQFNAQKSARVASALKTGNELYSQGEIEQALAVWRKAQTLVPENVELRANIARAEKLLENLRALSAPFGHKR
ncbi:tetratricopeptide repeat protein [Microbulbifer elongatus]|uniref:tetratricopeptide repeat protein n=1 Tax=Microbulbifer elongatus TaxID=86173 RepID=UPI001E5303E5|nr:tetratricopeptide repeat protein [Microbulbifer elongatus]